MTKDDLEIMKIKHNSLISQSKANYDYFNKHIDNFDGLRKITEEKGLKQANNALDRLYKDLEWTGR